MSKKRGLGRSLEALLKPSPMHNEAALVEHEEETSESADKRLSYLSLKDIQPGKYQPRQGMNPESLQELAESIRSQGVIQPIVVRPIKGSVPYEIIAGERRFRAASLAGLTEIPAVLREVSDEAALAMALIENIQRESLNPIEEALSMEKLIEEFKMTHQQVAEALGKSRTSITNSLRLLSLHPEVKSMLEAGMMEMGHARALLSLPPAAQLQAAKTISQNGLSVRQTEVLVRGLQTPKSGQIMPKAPLDPDIKRLQDSLSHRLGVKVNIDTQLKGRGKIILHYNNLTEFDNLLALLPD